MNLELGDYMRRKKDKEIYIYHKDSYKMYHIFKALNNNNNGISINVCAIKSNLDKVFEPVFDFGYYKGNRNG